MHSTKTQTRKERSYEKVKKLILNFISNLVKCCFFRTQRLTVVSYGRKNIIFYEKNAKLTKSTTFNSVFIIEFFLNTAYILYIYMGHFMGDLQSNFFFRRKIFFCLFTSKIIDTYFFFNVILENFEI